MLTLFLLSCATSPPPLVNGVVAVELEGAVDWRARGFEPITPPAHLPSASADLDQVEIWMSAPATGLTLVERSDGRWVTEWPEGTTAERVEYRGQGADRHIVDIRGTRVGADGVLFDHIYRPDSDGSLFGYEWPSEDLSARDSVTERMIARTGRSSLAKKMNCTGCHTRLRPDNTTPREHGIVNRGTDATGWFTPTTALYDRVPLESYGTHDLNLTDPNVDVMCGDTPAQTVDRKGVQRFRCGDRTVPIAVVKASSPSACNARRWVRDRLSSADLARLPAGCEP